MKDLLNESTSKSKSEPSSSKDVEELKAYIIQLENKCALLALDAS